MEIFGLIFLVIIAFFVTPFITFIGGWISGWLIKITIGQSVVNGLALLGLTIPLEKFPLFFGTLATIACFFHTPNINTKSKSK